MFNQTMKIIGGNDGDNRYNDLIEQNKLLTDIVDKYNEELHNIKGLIEFCLIKYSKCDILQILYYGYVKFLSDRELYNLIKKMKMNENIDNDLFTVDGGFE